VSIAAFDDFQIQKPPIFQIDVGQSPSVAILTAGALVILQSHSFSICCPTGKFAGLLAEVLDRLLGVDSFGRINTDQSDALATIKNQGVAINYSRHLSPLSGVCYRNLG
jgi:hypothetical protein